MAPLDLQFLFKTCYSCKECSSHLEFRGRHGAAFLFKDVVNVCVRDEEERVFTTGMHRVKSVYCICGLLIGWKYVFAAEMDQKYKEGKYTLESELLKLINM